MANWTIDTTHTEIGFKVKHLVVTTVSGKFTTFEGTISAEKDDFSDIKILFTADIDSIHTGNEQRDNHLKSADFFDAANYPKLSFTSTSVEKDGSDLIIHGDLTIRGTTKPVTLKAEYGGTEKSPYGHTVAGFEVTTKINRQDFGLAWGVVTEAGGLVVANDIKIVATVELMKK